MTLDLATHPRILLVDDHASFRETARHVLECEGYEVVAEAATGEEAIARAAAHAPEIVLLDVGLPDVDGFAVAATLAVVAPSSRVVLVSCRPLSDLGADRVAASGAVGFVAKDDLSRAAVEAVLAPPSAA